MREVEGRQASLLSLFLSICRPAGSPVGHREQREPRPIRGEPRWTEMHTHKHTHTHTRIHTLTQSLTCHMLSHLHCHQAACNPRALRGIHTRTHAHAQYVRTQTQSVTHKKVIKMCDGVHTHTQTAEVFPVCNWR